MHQSHAAYQAEKEKEITQKKKKIKYLHQKLRRKQTSIGSMKRMICMLKKKLLIKHSEEMLLHHKFDGFRSSILQNIQQNSIKGASKGR